MNSVGYGAVSLAHIGLNEIKKTARPLFLPDGIECPAVKVFKAGKELRIGFNNIRFVSRDFEDVIRGVTEKNVPSVFVRSRRLARPATTFEICKKIGKSKAIRLTHLSYLLGNQKDSFLTPVLINGAPWAVCARWSPDGCGGWGVGVCSVAGLAGVWVAGYQVLSQV